MGNPCGESGGGAGRSVDARQGRGQVHGRSITPGVTPVMRGTMGNPTENILNGWVEEFAGPRGAGLKIFLDTAWGGVGTQRDAGKRLRATGARSAGRGEARRAAPRRQEGREESAHRAVAPEEAQP